MGLGHPPRAPSASLEAQALEVVREDLDLVGRAIPVGNVERPDSSTAARVQLVGHGGVRWGAARDVKLRALEEGGWLRTGPSFRIDSCLPSQVNAKNALTSFSQGQRCAGTRGMCSCRKRASPPTPSWRLVRTTGSCRRLMSLSRLLGPGASERLVGLRSYDRRSSTPQAKGGGGEALASLGEQACRVRLWGLRARVSTVSLDPALRAMSRFVPAGVG
jgi:hypothetical protein